MSSIKQLRLNTVTNARRTFARVMRAYWEGDVDEQKARTMAYLFSTFLQSFKIEQTAALVERMEAVESRLDEREGIRRIG